MSDKQTLKAGSWIAAAVREGSGDLAYIGQVEAIDEDGLRLKLREWADGCVGWELHIRWTDLKSVEVLHDGA